jgi:aryl-alcohol dehydrogenase-like predicted oxidoreductase
LVHRDEFERELRDACLDQELGVIPYSPLAGGFLTEKYLQAEDVPSGSRGQGSQRIQAYRTKENLALLDTMHEIGEGHGKTVAQVALAWQLTQPIITSPIVGARTIEQIEESIGAIGFRLEPHEMDILDQMSGG